MKVPEDKARDRAFMQDFGAAIVKHIPSLEAVTTAAATGIASTVIVFSEAGFDIHEDRAGITRVLTDLLRIVQSANPLVAANALGLLTDEQIALLEGRATQMRLELAKAGFQQRK